jgi:heme exporter protein D
MGEFFAMGGYAQFVWPVYIITLIVLLANVVAPWRREKQLRRRLAQRERRASRGMR